MAKRWYSVSVLSNFEKKIAEQIKVAVEEAGLENEIEEVLVPTEEVIEVRRGKKVTAERRFMPGYVLVRMEMSLDCYVMLVPNRSLPRTSSGKLSRAKARLDFINTHNLEQLSAAAEEVRLRVASA
mgnify:CR=1 FL=1